MTTKMIGLKEFRQNISALTINAKAKNVRYIILKKNVPVLEVKAIDEKDLVLSRLGEQVKKARAQIKKGQIYTQDQIMKEFGLK